MANILSIGQSALNTANLGIATTGHNIANAITPGYNRQVVMQASLAGQNLGSGFIGKGVEVTGVRRVYSEFLGNQVLTAQTSSSQLETYYSQISQINNMLADSTIGLSPSLQNFFNGVQSLSASVSSAAARQTLLSSAETLVARFQSLSAQLNEMNQGVNSQIETTVIAVNTYARQIADLNDAIEKAVASSGGNMPNDLMDQRDQVIADLSKEVKVSVVKQGSSYDIYIGNGQPMVVGATTYNLKAINSLTDPSRTVVAYDNNGATTVIAESALAGGTLSGLLEFRSETLDVAQNSLGRIAIILASDFNKQHMLGMDLSGNQGQAFFDITTKASPVVNASILNKGNVKPTATITDASKLTTSDYQLQFDGAAYTVTRLSDGQKFAVSTPPAGTEIDGVTFTVSSDFQAGDTFLIRPTANGASGISVAIKDTASIAAAAPIKTAATASNTGTASISAGVVNSPIASWNNLLQPASISFTSSTQYTVSINGVVGPPQTYSAGSDISYNGWTVQITGVPKMGDTFTIGSNVGGTGDNRNALLLGALQTANNVANGTTSYQGAYSQLVNRIGNKTAELESSSAAASKLLTQAIETQQSQSGVNLDEEAANLLRYQQAYQAAAKVMKMASDLFDELLSISR